MNTKQTIGAATLAAAALTVGVTTAIPDTTEIEGGYRIDIVNPYRAEVYLDVPEEFTPDIVTLYLNDMEISKALLPNGAIVTYPVVVSDTDRLSMEMYVRGDEAATAYFEENGKLIINVKDKYLDGAEGTTENAVPEVTEEVVTETAEVVTEIPESVAEITEAVTEVTETIEPAGAALIFEEELSGEGEAIDVE